MNKTFDRFVSHSFRGDSQVTEGERRIWTTMIDGAMNVRNVCVLLVLGRPVTWCLKTETCFFYTICIVAGNKKCTMFWPNEARQPSTTTRLNVTFIVDVGARDAMKRGPPVQPSGCTNEAST